MSCTDEKTFREILQEVARETIQVLAREGRQQSETLNERISRLEERQDRLEGELRRSVEYWRRQWEMVVTNGE